MSVKRISTEEFDRLFDEGKEDITPYMDMSSLRRPGLEIKRVNVDFPSWMVDRLDDESSRIGITRQALIKSWLAEKLGAK
jgi:hypothetical protein